MALHQSSPRHIWDFDWRRNHLASWLLSLPSRFFIDHNERSGTSWTYLTRTCTTNVLYTLLGVRFLPIACICEPKDPKGKAKGTLGGPSFSLENLNPKEWIRQTQHLP